MYKSPSLLLKKSCIFGRADMSIGGDDYKGSILPILMLRLAPVWRSGEESAAEIEYLSWINFRVDLFSRGLIFANAIFGYFAWINFREWTHVQVKNTLFSIEKQRFWWIKFRECSFCRLRVD